ncbi:hypothetical protein BUALT_Bualt17G0001900 [Buddleja alternifolia]|uniref:F-box/LRR-repeat protein 15-like leucin rich repeat domain-containing protein n=1 Tax=Buddleja alternifolia TaxID=168488 RepID=A0AAV6W3E5_9LAMI|nr:hypothetical protein BUALT_Bualt17G0001900 [Buddleja alternifolia]
MGGSREEGGGGINSCLGDDELRAVLWKVEDEKDKEAFGLVCKRWLRLQSSERRKLCARAGPHMLKRIAARFNRLRELHLSQSLSRSFYPGVTDSDLCVIADSFSALTLLNLHNCKGISFFLSLLIITEHCGINAGLRYGCWQIKEEGLELALVTCFVQCLPKILFYSSLQGRDICDASITDKGMTAIGSGLPSLQSLDVSYCRKLTDKGLSSVAKGCHDLRALHVAGCRFVTDILLTNISENCNNLEELGLQGCTNLTDSGLTVLVEGCKRLKHLDLNKCSNIGDIAISSIAKACSSLLTLKLLDCYQIGDDSILSLAKYCKNLETLIIGGCRDVSDESLKSLAAACCSSLKNLRMDWCLNVSDNSLECIFYLCRKLEVLDVGCCEEVTDAAFQGLGNEEDRKLNLKILRVSNCPKITVDGIRKLLKSCEGLEYLDVRSCPHVTELRCNEAGLQFPGGCKVNYAGSLAEPDVLR